MCSRNPRSIFPHHLRQQHKHERPCPSLSQFGLSATFARPPRNLAPPRRLRDSDTYTRVKKKRLRLQAATTSVLVYQVCSTRRVSVTPPMPDGYGDGQESIPETVNGDGDGMNSPCGKENVPAIPDGYIPLPSLVRPDRSKPSRTT